MGKKLFGTDGIRGKANQHPITPEFIVKIAGAAIQHFCNKIPNQLLIGHDHKFTVVIGKDTRLSGYMVESALTAGFVAMGANVILLGPIPTPAVAMLTRSLRAHLGVVISASHNLYQDNGIKFFNYEGLKISDEDEIAIEQQIYQPLDLSPSHFGKAIRLDDAVGRYIEYVKATFPKGMVLDGIKVVVDSAHGAAYKVAPKVFWELGAEVFSIGNEPNGYNINDGYGATNTANLQKAVLQNHANIGIALDGDADRLIIVDENGSVIDGDQIMAAIAKLWFEQGILTGGGVVATHMSNLGFERYLHNKGLNLYRTAVGDRNVLIDMQKKGCNLGGEQSGHIIFSDYCSTGDGLIAALQVLSLLVATQLPTSSINETFKPVPQILKNIHLDNSSIDMKDLKEAITQAEKKLNGDGRVLVRKSGTEPLIRIMAQGDNLVLLNNIIDDIYTAVNMCMNNNK